MKAGINSVLITSSWSPPHQTFEHRTETRRPARLHFFLWSKALKERRRKLYLFLEPTLSSELSVTDSGSCWKNTSSEKCQHQSREILQVHISRPLCEVLFPNESTTRGMHWNILIVRGALTLFCGLSNTGFLFLLLFFLTAPYLASQSSDLDPL